VRRTLVILTLTAGVLAACASSASAPEPKPDDGGPAPTSGVGGGVGGGNDQVVLPDQRLIVRVGEMELQVGDVAATFRQVRQLALRLGGYVGDSQFASDGGDHPTATVVLRIPAERYDEALDALRPLAEKVLVEQSKESDVTSQVVDLDARIANLRATESAMQKLMDRATKVSEVLEVQHELTNVRQQIEQLTAQKQLLEKQAALATLTVTLTGGPQPVGEVARSWDPGADVERAVAALVDVGQNAARALIWLVIVVLPLVLGGALVAALGIGVARWLGPRLRREVGPPPQAPA
jgi:hypothetical protein